MCSLGMRVMVMVMVVASDDRMLAILTDTYVRVVTGMWSTVAMILCLSVDRQRSIQAAGVDAMHDLRVI